MNAYGHGILIALLLVLLDLPWLTLIGGNYAAAVQAIQGGREVRMRPIAGLVVYPALAYLALQSSSLKNAFLTGASVYAVYDFTVLAVFKDYPLYLAIGDSLWGGCLFTLVYLIRSRFIGITLPNK
jgi:uncharacterized membrane protein